MAYAISLWFDSFGEEAIRGYWEGLHEHGLTSFLRNGNFRPHITLAVYEELEVAGFKSALDNLLADVPQFELTLPSVGFFTAPSGQVSLSGNAVFLNVTPTAGLLGLHAQVHQVISRFGASPRPYYLPEHWNPHSTLAREITSESIAPIIKYCQTIILPIRPVVNRIGIIDTPREVELECCHLSVG